MKIPALLPMILLSIALPVFAGIISVRLDVDPRSKSKGNPTAPGKPPSEKTQEQSLMIKLFNTSTESIGDLTVKYWFFARDIKGHGSTVFKQGESRTSLEKNERKTVESETVTTKYTDAYTKFEASGPNKTQKATRVPAVGQKLTGYAVQVLNGGKVISEYYSDNSYKQMVAGTAPAK